MKSAGFVEEILRYDSPLTYRSGSCSIGLSAKPCMASGDQSRRPVRSGWTIVRNHCSSAPVTTRWYSVSSVLTRGNSWWVAILASSWACCAVSNSTRRCSISSASWG